MDDLILMPDYLEDYLKNQLPEGQDGKFFLTKDEYNFYRSIDIDGLDYDDIFQLQSRPREDNYAQIIEGPDGISDLAREYFLAINLELGYESLPRSLKRSNLLMNNLGGGLELLANLSSLDMMEKALLSKDGVKLVNSRPGSLDKLYFYKNLRLNEDNYLAEFFWDIRIFSLSIIQDRGYSLEERLIFLGIAYEHMELLNNKESFHLIPDKLEELNDIFRSPELRIFFTRLKSNNDLKLDLIREILSWDLELDMSNREEELASDFMDGFQERDRFKSLADLLRDNRDSLADYLEDRDYLVENYIFNYAYISLLPFIRENLKLSYLELISNYIFLETKLLGLAGSGDLDDGHILRGLANSYALDQPYGEEIMNYLIEKEYISMEYIILLLAGGIKDGK